MSYANGTTHYNLPQTVGTDKRDWTDTNQAFADVDAALYTAADTASTAASNISTLDAQINTPSTGIDARLTSAEQDIVSLDGRLDTAEGTIGQHTLDIADVRSDLQDAIVAYNEATATSTHVYSVGDFFFYNDILYKATTSIAIGDTIVPNTNCSATNVMTEVDAINTALSDLEIKKIAESTGTTVATHLTSLQTAFASLTDAQKKRAILVQSNNISHINSLGGSFTRSIVGNTSTTISTYDIVNATYIRMTSDAGGNTISDNSSQTAGAPFELWA